VTRLNDGVAGSWRLLFADPACAILGMTRVAAMDTCAVAACTHASSCYMHRLVADGVSGTLCCLRWSQGVRLPGGLTGMQMWWRGSQRLYRAPGCSSRCGTAPNAGQAMAAAAGRGSRQQQTRGSRRHFGAFDDGHGDDSDDDDYGNRSTHIPGSGGAARPEASEGGTALTSWTSCWTAGAILQRPDGQDDEDSRSDREGPGQHVQAEWGVGGGQTARDMGNA